LAANGRVASIGLFRRLVRCALALEIITTAHAETTKKLGLGVNADGSVNVSKSFRLLFGQLYGVALYGGGEAASGRAQKLRSAASAGSNDDEEEDETLIDDDDDEEVSAVSSSTFTTRVAVERKKFDLEQLTVLDACAQSVHGYVERESERRAESEQS
jgi:hypothetical protein